MKDPALVHFSCCWPKVWTNGTKNLFRSKKVCLRYQKEFYYYVNKTRFFNEIYNKLFFRKKKVKKEKIESKEKIVNKGSGKKREKIIKKEKKEKMKNSEIIERKGKKVKK